MPAKYLRETPNFHFSELLTKAVCKNSLSYLRLLSILFSNPVWPNFKLLCYDQCRSSVFLVFFSTKMYFTTTITSHHLLPSNTMNFRYCSLTGSLNGISIYSSAIFSRKTGLWGEGASRPPPPDLPLQFYNFHLFKFQLQFRATKLPGAKKRIVNFCAYLTNVCWATYLLALITLSYFQSVSLWHCF